MNNQTIVIEIEKPKGVCQTTLNYLESGHVPGHLSGAVLRGKAKKFGIFYQHCRYHAAQIARDHQVYNKLALINHRWCRVWTTCDGSPVRIVLR